MEIETVSRIFYYYVINEKENDINLFNDIREFDRVICFIR